MTWPSSSHLLPLSALFTQQHPLQLGSTSGPLHLLVLTRTCDPQATMDLSCPHLMTTDLLDLEYSLYPLCLIFIILRLLHTI